MEDQKARGVSVKVNRLVSLVGEEKPLKAVNRSKTLWLPLPRLPPHIATVQKQAKACHPHITLR